MARLWNSKIVKWIEIVTNYILNLKKSNHSKCKALSLPIVIALMTLELLMSYSVDAVGSWQIILPMPNLERPYQSYKGSQAVLRCLQYKQCAGPQKVSKFRF